MSLTASPRYRRVFIQQQTSGSPRVIPNAAGTWTNTGVKLLRVPQNSIRITPDQPITPIPWLTGTRSTQPGISGRKSASWELNNLPIIPSGTAGTVPDSDALWQAVFGQAAAVSVGTNVAYSFSDSGYLPITLFDFQHSQPTLSSRLVWGCVPTEVTFTFNGNVFEANVRGEGGYALDSTGFSVEPDTTAKAGLTVWPTEPSSPTVIGNIIAGFKGTASFHGQAIETSLRSMTIKIETGTRWVKDVFSDAYPVQIVGGERKITVTLGVLDTDLVTLNDLKQQAKTQANVVVSIVLGTVAGYKIQFDLPSLQMQPYEFGDQNDIVMTNFGEAGAHASALGATDDLTFTLL